MSEKTATIKRIVHCSIAMVFAEMMFKISNSNTQYWIMGGGLFFVSYVLCILTDLMGFGTYTFVKSWWFRSILSLLHGLDGAAALLIGLAILYRNLGMLFIALVMMSKFYLIHLLNRMILANKKTDNIHDSVTQTTKSYLHHVASFLFLQSRNEIIIITVWRTISMSGHAALVMRETMSHEALRRLHWCLAYLRILFMMFLLWACSWYPALRGEFAQSAVGHIAYMAVRIEPVFKQGGIYLTTEEKVSWTQLSSSEKASALSRGQHPWLCLELMLLAVLIALFAVLRFELLLMGAAVPDVPYLNGNLGVLGWSLQ